MTDATTLPERLLGRPSTDPGVATVLAALDDGVTWDRSDDSFWWVSRASGIDVRTAPGHDRIDTVFCFAEGAEDHEQYAGALPRDIQFSWHRSQVLSELGTPDKSGPSHDSWNTEDFRLVVRYDAAGSIIRVTATTA